MKTNTILQTLALLFLIGTIAIPAAAAWPEQVFAPYVDTGLWPDFSITEMAEETGVKYYTLAFIVSDRSGNPAWAGVIPLSDMHFKDQIDELRAQGGDVIISFGGAANQELALVDHDVTSLAAKYQSVIDAYDVTRLDFDIEGSAVADKASVSRRNQAIRILQQDNPGLFVAYCLPVLPSGLTSDGVALIADAKDAGVRVDLVNIMVMDYGDWAAPDPDGKMGTYAIEAAESVVSQLRTVYPEKSDAEIHAMIGLTPMIGQNDLPPEVFTLADAQQMTDYAKEQGIGLIAMWSANRDSGSCGRTTWAANTCSGIVQDEFAFSRIFNTVTTGGSTIIVPVTTPVPTTVPTSVPTTAIPLDPLVWDMVKAYAAGETATYDGEEYSAKWWTQGETPGIAYVWQCTTCDGTKAPSAWNPAKVYEAGDRTVFNSVTYRAKWWTQGDVPGTAAVWEYGAATVPDVAPTTVPIPEPTPDLTPAPVPAVTTPLPTPVPEPTVTPEPGVSGDAWSVTGVYVKGDIVTREGMTYRARWWTLGEEPGTAMVWEVLTESAPSDWNSARIYVKGDRALHAGTLFEARWWTLGDTPGTAVVWQQVAA